MVELHLMCPICDVARELVERTDLEARVYICPKCGSMGIEGYRNPVLHFDFELQQWFVVEKDEIDVFKEAMEDVKREYIEDFKKKNVL